MSELVEAVEQRRMRGATVDYVINHLRDGIFQGQYAPGQRLVEADLTRELGISRGPLREALHRLAADIRPIWEPEERAPGRGYISENKAFHDAIIRASGNETLGVVTGQLQLPLLMFQFNKMLTVGNIAASLAEHRAIAEAMLEGDTVAADGHMRAHLERARQVASEMPSQVFRNDARPR